jgi:hypothetical protein
MPSGIAQHGIAAIGIASQGIARLGLGAIYVASPLRDVLQWIWKFVFPTTGSDKSTNELDLDYVENACLQFDGVADYVQLPAAPSRSTLRVVADVKLRSSDYSFTLGLSYSGVGFVATGLGSYSSGGSPRLFIRSGNLAGDGYVQSAPVVSAIASYYDDKFHEVEFALDYDTSTLEWKIDGNSVYVGSLDGVASKTAVINAIGRHTSGFIGDSYNKADLSRVEIYLDEVLWYKSYHSETSGDTTYDISGNGNDGTLSGTIATMRTTDDDAPANNIDNGFSLYEHATSDDLLVPYGDDGNPLTITPPVGYTKTSDNPPCGVGRIHNYAESRVRQKDENTEFLTNPFWSADGINYDAKSIEDILAHYNLDDNVAFKWDEDCFLTDALTWPSAYQWTLEAALFIIAWLGTSCGAGSLEVAYDADGTPIYDEDGSVLLEPPA